MIKITRFFYIHILTIPLLLLACAVGALRTTLMAYCIVSVHELFHLFAALLLSVRVKSVIVMPFGMTLRLSDALIRQPAKEILIALAGPFANVLMLVICAALRHYYIWAEESMFLCQGINRMILLLNLTPALPLDGGRALRAVLAHCFGYLTAMKVMRRLTRVISVAFLGMGALLLWVTKGNISLLMIAAFLLFQMTEEKKTTDLFVLKELMRSKEKLLQQRLMTSKVISAAEHTRAKFVLRRISYDSYFLIYITDPQGRGRFITEAQLVAALLEKGYGVRLGEIAPQPFFCEFFHLYLSSY